MENGLTALRHNVGETPFIQSQTIGGFIDSKVLKEFNSGARTSEAVAIAEGRYISSIYFHSLFLFATTNARKYDLRRGEDPDSEPVEISEHVADLFSALYARFMLHSETADLLEAIG